MDGAELRVTASSGVQNELTGNHFLSYQRIVMIYTPLSNYTNEELIAAVTNDPEPTWMELELMQRVELLQEEMEELTAAYKGEVKDDDLDCEKIYGVAV